jgi:multimeric flavodoxin WrbA
VVERLYSSGSEYNDQGQFPYYGKVGGWIVTGNEDGVKHASMNLCYSLTHLGFTVPPNGDAGWIGEIGPGPSYGDPVEGSDIPMGYGSDFTNKNATIMSWNLMHAAKMLKDQGGFPVGGNVAESWQSTTNAADQDPDRRW